MTVVATRKNTTIARPLKVLLPLIKEELAKAESAGLEHYRRAGEMLLEAREQIPYGNFRRWLATNFHLGKSTAYYYMDLAKKDEVVHRGGQAEPTSLRAAIGRKPDYAKWKPLQEAARGLDAELFATERQTEQEEIGLHRDLAAELVDIGYKALATRLHPDKGGSKDAMVRLKRVRDELAARGLDAELFATERQTEQEEIGLHRDLAAELVDIGYKALATRLHPDKGGSKDAMVRLKRVRDELMTVAKTRRFV